MNDQQPEAEWSVAEWHGKTLVDRDGEKIGKLEDVYVDVESDMPQFATVSTVDRYAPRHGAEDPPTNTRPNKDDRGAKDPQAGGAPC